MKISDSIIKKSCSQTIYKRGLEYFKEGRVHIRKREENTVTAVVDGNELYHVMVKYSPTGINDYFCSCPYYETMDCVCKHIVAVMKQRQAELADGESYMDENDKLASSLCNEYSKNTALCDPVHLGFLFYINQISRDPSYSIAITADGEQVRGLENFLDSLTHKKAFKLAKGVTYTPEISFPGAAEKKILDILAENYQNKSTGDTFYTKAAYRTNFGYITAGRIMPLLKHTDYKLYLDGMLLPDAQIMDDNPDIIVDIEALSGEITLSVSECGTALVPDGSWFLYEDNVYATDEEWRKWFMPIYNAVTAQNRTQLSFKGENTASFASVVLPHIKDRHGVVARGIDELVTNENPTFSIYLDTSGQEITAVVRVDYGGVSLRLPSSTVSGNKIVIRDFEKENEILSHFSDFQLRDGVFHATDDNVVFSFLSESMTTLAKLCDIYSSDALEHLRLFENRSISGHIKYNYDVNLLETDFDTDLSYEELQGILSAVQLRKSFYRLKDGCFLDLEEPDTIFKTLSALDFSSEELKKRKKYLAPYQALYLSASSNDGLKREESFLNYIDTIKQTRAAIPGHLKTVLRGYQVEGLNWLKQLSMLGFGGILADDMGLGKTLQVIAYICGEQPDLPVLIVTPSALVYNWLAEIQKFAPDESAIIIEGTKDERSRLLSEIGRVRFVITSYPLLRRDIHLYKDLHFSYCFIDEAQYIKNPNTMSARGVKKIKAGIKFALTGTPIENSLTELWSIFDFVTPGYMYSRKKFQEIFETPIVKDKDNSVMEQLKAKIRPFILRRMKSDVLSELPEKLETTMFSDLLPAQKKLYSAFLATAKKSAAELLSQGSGSNMRILTLLMRLRQICCHPKLFDAAYTDGSGKLELLDEIIQSGVSAGHRILIFSQFTSMLSIISKQLDERKTDYFYLDGQTPSYTRSEYADRFNGGEKSVFLISLKAGGAGLNLTGADMVIHYDPWWNPATMDQASDRAYRIGQTRAVQVIRLAAKGTIEERILNLQEKKRMLADGVITANSVAPSKLSREEILSLFEE